MKKQWEILRPDDHAVQSIRESLPCHTATAVSLANRRIRTGDEALRFVRPSLNQLQPPFELRDVQKAVERIHLALKRREKIMVFGDYDVDGITATVLLLDLLKRAGGRVIHYIPHRIDEGYGLQSTHITQYAGPKGVDLLITVDCGSASHEAIEAANRLGMDVIITDHHNISKPWPRAFAVVNPKRKDCSAGFEPLAGVGVAFCLAVCLRKYLRDRGHWKKGSEPNLRRYTDLVALGTMADMVPLRGDNRVLALTGIQVMNETPRPGIAALMESAGMKIGEIGAEEILFRMVPRLNAAGRIEHADEAVKLLTAADPSVAKAMARRLGELNTQRQEIENRILEQILNDFADDPSLLGKKTIVMVDTQWHEGVLGVVAAKLLHRFHRPVILLSARDSAAKGSGRSIPGVDLFHALSACSKHISAFGGHSLAAGLRLNMDCLQQFRDDFEAVIEDSAAPEDFVPKVFVDYELTFAKITPALVDELEWLQPFGTDNPAPLFMTTDVDVVSSGIVGNQHRRMILRQKGKPSVSFNAIQFHTTAAQSALTHFDRIAFHLQWNRWNGQKKIQLLVKEAI